MTVDLDRGLPEGMAILVVLPVRSPGGEWGFRMRGHCCCGAQQDFPAYDRPDIALAKLVAKGGKAPSEVLATMRSWSSRRRELTRWLDDRRCAHGDSLELVIWDETGYGIPWELFWLSPQPGSGRRAGWLGGVVTVTRWLSICTDWPVVRDYWSAHECAGPVASYVADDMRHDDRLLEQFSLEPLAGIPALPKALASGGPLGMVYLACHGTFGSDLSTCELDKVKLLLLHPERFDRLMTAATFVFLNACHSGRLIAERGVFADPGQSGFSEVFLRSGAAGVLATSGEIGDEEAHQMADQLLAVLRDRPTTPVAVALRELRAEIAQVTPMDLLGIEGLEEQKQLLPLLYRFMYVYYGSPRTVVALTPRGGP
ncbi:CHAT domain-containing protein [Streptomyces xantholiticus]|uniref:CHAT domain-containing protein n=1 Tax=Streptomyces xantholiticus TaxID=68285 RepID=UPI00167BC365|nr:CHAT domain-containing protein [Streptomyces xantholiticus]GGW50227.1 hypothetical protein GCM10010381_39630 [Streptomyces xantholiticus]